MEAEKESACCEYEAGCGGEEAMAGGMWVEAAISTVSRKAATERGPGGGAGLGLGLWCEVAGWSVVLSREGASRITGVSAAGFPPAERRGGGERRQRG